MSSMIITTARMTRAAPAQDMGFVNGNAKTSRTACVSLRITRTPTTKLSGAGGPRRPNWKAARPARVRSSDLVGPAEHIPDRVHSPLRGTISHVECATPACTSPVHFMTAPRSRSAWVHPFARFSRGTRMCSEDCQVLLCVPVPMVNVTKPSGASRLPSITGPTAVTRLPTYDLAAYHWTSGVCRNHHSAAARHAPTNKSPVFFIRNRCWRRSNRPDNPRSPGYRPLPSSSPGTGSRTRTNTTGCVPSAESC